MCTHKTLIQEKQKTKTRKTLEPMYTQQKCLLDTTLWGCFTDSKMCGKILHIGLSSWRGSQTVSNNHKFRGALRHGSCFPLSMDKVGHSLNGLRSLSQKWLPGLAMQAWDLCSAHTTKCLFISCPLIFKTTKT